MVLIFICILFCLLAVAGMINLESGVQKWLCMGAGVLMFIAAAFRGEGVDRDYQTYQDVFLSNDDLAIVEPTFYLIKSLVINFMGGKIVFLFAFYAFLGVFTKVLAIRKLSGFPILSMVVYLSYSYIVNDLTQIRAGVSIGLLLLSIQPIYERKFLQFFLLWACATLFHYSASIMFFLWFMNGEKISKLYLSIFLVTSYIAGPVLEQFLSRLAEYIPILAFQQKLKAYEYDFGNHLNIFNVWQLLRIALCALFLWKAEYLQSMNRYSFLLIKMYVFATGFYVLLAANPSFASRVSDLFAGADIVLLPMIGTLTAPKVVGRIAVVLISFSYLFLNLFYNKIISG